MVGARVTIGTWATPVACWRPIYLVLPLLALLAVAVPTSAHAQSRVQISKLSDASFGTIANFTADAVRRQDLCVYSSSPRRGYNVRASGSGPGGAFTIQNGGFTIPYEVQGADFAGSSFGYTLIANVLQTGAGSSASSPTCSSGPSVTASLIITIRAAALQNAMAGNYAGTLTIVIAPE